MAETNIDLSAYPSNSKIKTETRKEPLKDEPKIEHKKKVDKVTTASVNQKKKRGKVASLFIAEDINNVRNYVVMEIIVPAIKNTISDALTNGIEMVLNVDGRRGSYHRGSGSSPSYRNYYESEKAKRDRRDYTNRGSRRSEDEEKDYNNIVVRTRGEAEEVLIKMEELIAAYGMASILDLYDLVDYRGGTRYTDDRYGWTNFRNADYEKVSNGYLLIMPKAQPLR